MADRLDREMSEGERRDLVRDIASRRERGYEIRDTVVEPQVDYAAAAAAAVAADPVELAPATEAELNEVSGEASQAGSRYAEAQRAIFDRGINRELDYGNVWYDDQQGVTDATNFALDEYQAAMERARAARPSGSGSGYGLDDWFPEDVQEDELPSWGQARMLLSGDQESVVEPYGSTEDFLAMQDTAQELFMAGSPALEFFTADPNTGEAPIDTILRAAHTRGMTWDMAVDRVVGVLSQDPNIGATPEQLRRLMLAAAPQWMERFNTAGRVGPTGPRGLGGRRRSGTTDTDSAEIGTAYVPMENPAYNPLSNVLGLQPGDSARSMNTYNPGASGVS